MPRIDALQCPMCGESESFVINPRNESEGFCLQERVTHVISPGLAATITRKPIDKINNHIMLQCPHCEQTYEAEIGNNPLVRDGLTITPLPLPAEIEVEGEQ